MKQAPPAHSCVAIKWQTLLQSVCCRFLILVKFDAIVFMRASFIFFRTLALTYGLTYYRVDPWGQQTDYYGTETTLPCFLICIEFMLA